MKPKIAFCFRGICKNFHPLYENYKEKIIEPLSKYYEIDFYLSTNLISNYTNLRNNENNEIYWDSILKYITFKGKIILPYQDPTLSIDILNFSNNLIDKHGGHWGETKDGWSYAQSKQSTYFAIKNIYSIYLLKSIINDTYDKYLITRQDLFFHNTLDVNLVVKSNSDAVIPSVKSWGGYCDRFAVLNKKAFDVYTNRYQTLRHNPIKYHEETYLKYECLDKNKVSVELMNNFDFTSIRSGDIGDQQIQRIKNEI